MMELIRKNLDLAVVAVLVIALVLYDVTIEIFLELLHMGFEVVHNLYEWLELGIEHLVEHLFHTSRHGSQIITFYILITLASLILWRLWVVLPRWYHAVRELLLEGWARRKTQIQLYWLTMSGPHKAALVVTVLVVAYLASFFVM